MKIIINKIFLFLGLLTNQLLMPALAVAQEITPTPIEEISPAPTSTPTPDITLTPTPTLPPEEVTPTPTPAEVLSVEPVTDPLLVVVVQDVGNSAIVDQTVVSQSNTGDNSVTNNGGDSTIVSGDSTAIGNAVTMANMTLADSKVKVYLLNSTSGEMTELDLNNLWKLLLEEEKVNGTTVGINNYAEITNEISAVANTGGNVISGMGDNIIRTGNAYALVNLINLVNANFVGSRVFVGVLNINANNLGDIILPNPETFADNPITPFTGSLDVNNYAEIISIGTANANTGNNTIQGNEAEIVTGNATSLTNVSTMANFNLINSSQMMLSINTLGNWSGSVFNWIYPGAVAAGIPGMFLSGAIGGISGTGTGVNIVNFANIYSMATANANTGGNSITGGDGSILTGDAYSLANISNMANLNVVGSDWFYGMINIIGDWNGNAIFAYPDMAISISSPVSEISIGDEYEVRVDYQNLGYDEAKKAKLSLDLPEGVNYVSDGSGQRVIRNGSSLMWDLGNVGAKAGGGFAVRLKVDGDNQAFNLVKTALAMEDQLKVVSSVSITNTEVTLDNNSAGVDTRVVNRNTGGSSNLEPKLVIWAKNNVNDFVYDGDTVRFEIKAKNEGEAKAYRTYLIHRIIANDSVLSESRINVGDVNINANGKIDFGVTIRYKAEASERIRSETYWVGEKEDGQIVESNMAETEFLVKSKLVNNSVNKPGQVQAVSLDGAILGDSTTCIPAIDLIPYVLLFIISSLWILNQTKKWQAERKN